MILMLYTTSVQRKKDAISRKYLELSVMGGPHWWDCGCHKKGIGE